VAVIIVTRGPGTVSPVAKLPGPSGSSGTGGITAVAFSPDGQTLAVADDDGSIYLWNVAARQLTETLADPAPGTSVLAVAFSPNGQILAAGAAQGTTYLWNVKEARLVDSLVAPGTGFGSNSIQSLAFSPAGTTLAIAAGFKAYLWSTVTGQPIATLGSYSGVASAVAFGRGGQTLAIGSLNGDVYLWDTAPARLARTLASPIGVQGLSIAAVAFSPDGQTLATGTETAGGEVLLWDAATGTHVATLNPSVASLAGVLSVAFSPDGRTVAAADGNRTYLWDLPASRPQPSQTLTDPGGKGVTSVAFSPDGKILATSDNDNAVYLWAVG
jgi:WD40 repeat protein